MARSKIEIMSIFGQIEEVVANEMVNEGKANKIEVKNFPDASLCPDLHYNEAGQPAVFAIMISSAYLPELNERIANLRA